VDAATIVIGRLADGPTPPTAASATSPNMLHTRVAEVVASPTSASW